MSSSRSLRSAFLARLLVHRAVCSGTAGGRVSCGSSGGSHPGWTACKLHSACPRVAPQQPCPIRTGATSQGEQRGGRLAAGGGALPATEHGCERFVAFLLNRIVMLWACEGKWGPGVRAQEERGHGRGQHLGRRRSQPSCPLRAQQHPPTPAAPRVLTVNSTNWGVSLRERPPGGSIEGHTQSGDAPRPGHLQRYQVGSGSSPSLGAAAGATRTTWSEGQTNRQAQAASPAGGGWRWLAAAVARRTNAPAALPRSSARANKASAEALMVPGPLSGGRSGRSGPGREEQPRRSLKTEAECCASASQQLLGAVLPLSTRARPPAQRPPVLPHAMLCRAVAYIDRKGNPRNLSSRPAAAFLQPIARRRFRVPQPGSGGLLVPQHGIHT